MLDLEQRDRNNPGKYLREYVRDKFVKKHQLDRQQIERIDRVKADWQSVLNAGVTDRWLAERSIETCYRQAHFPPPRIIWADNPLDVIKILSVRADLYDISDEINQELWESERQIQREIAFKSASLIAKDLVPQYSCQTPSDDRHYEFSGSYLDRLLLDRSALITPGYTVPTPCQNYNIEHLAYFDYFRQIGIELLQIRAPIDLAKACGWCWTFEKLAILTPKPTRLSIDRFGQNLGIIYNETNILI